MSVRTTIATEPFDLSSDSATQRNDNMAKESISKERKAEELSLARKIMDVLSRKADELAQGGSEATQKFRLEPAERQILLEINNFGMASAIGAGVLSLIALRRIRYSMLRRLYGNKPSGPPGQPPSHHPSAPPPTYGNNPFQSNNPFSQSGSQFHSPPPPFTSPSSASNNSTIKQGTVSFLFGWAMDLAGAFAVTVTTSMLLTDMGQILEKLSKIPLTEGRSTVAREFCPDVVQTLKDIQQNDSAAASVIDSAQTLQLQAVIQFAENCKRRAAFEKTLRKEKGVGPSYPVQVPLGGVPPDYPITSDTDEEEDDRDRNDDHRSGFEGDFYEPPTEGFDAWADDFTNDRENDDSK